MSFRLFSLTIMEMRLKIRWSLRIGRDVIVMIPQFYCFFVAYSKGVVHKSCGLLVETGSVLGDSKPAVFIL